MKENMYIKFIPKEYKELFISSYNMYILQKRKGFNRITTQIVVGCQQILLFTSGTGSLVEPILNLNIL